MRLTKLAGLVAALATVALRPARGQPAAGPEMFSGIPATGIRALSALTDSVVWATGTEGYVGMTTNGYRSCVLFVSAGTLLATGPSGTDLSTDDG